MKKVKTCLERGMFFRQSRGDAGRCWTKIVSMHSSAILKDARKQLITPLSWNLDK
jgi:hypothetical protein